MAKPKPNIKSSKEMNKKEKQEAKKPLSKEELLVKYRAALLVMKMKNKMGQLVKTHQIKQVKKEIARLLTKNNSLVGKENK
jgi:ribosomal protein L29